MEIPRLDWDNFTNPKKDYVTVEHIYPKVAKSSNWPLFGELPVRLREMLLNSLGNLLSLSVSRNSKFSNRPFATKKHDTDGIKGYYNGSYSEIRVAQYEDWTPESIKDRGLKMVEFLENRWDVSLSSPDEKLQFLSLDFHLT